LIGPALLGRVDKVLLRTPGCVHPQGSGKPLPNWFLVRPYIVARRVRKLFELMFTLCDLCELGVAVRYVQRYRRVGGTYQRENPKTALSQGRLEPPHELRGGAGDSLLLLTNPLGGLDFIVDEKKEI
jgi:hypothetical protein